ncbi:MAG: hypothetical protein IJ120_04865 [Solobacterium sp.]|nr:hypothetical protein [Solobacterium sp.]
MALYTLNFESQYLHNNTEVSVIMPDRPRMVEAEEFYGNGKKYSVLWLLHGTFGDHTDWIRHTNIELYACERNLIVVMPSALNSDYVNWPGFGMGYDMEKFMVKELMPMIYNWFPASKEREDNFIAGLSMGSMGAALFSTWYPEKFGASAWLSGCPQNWHTTRNLGSSTLPPSRRNENIIDNEGGIEKLLNSHRNVWDRLKEMDRSALPRLFICSGTDDFLYENNYLVFKEYAQEIGLQAEFEELEGYTHEWRFWDKEIEKALDFFSISNKDGGNAF